MENKKYKLYLASGIKLWTMDFKDNYSPFFNHKVELFQPALIDKQYTGNHRLIPIKIATKDLGEINKCDAILAYMKMYDTAGNGPAGTDSTWECGYAIGKEKPTIMLVEDVQHLDYYSVQWMVTYSIGAILTTNKEVVAFAKNNEKFTHTAVLHCEKKEEFEDKIIEYLDNYHKSIYAREGVINYQVDIELRNYANHQKIIKIFEEAQKSGSDNLKQIREDFKKIFIENTRFDNKTIYNTICTLEFKRAKIIKEILVKEPNSLTIFLNSYIKLCLENFENKPTIEEIAKMIEYWLSIPAEEVKGRKQGKKKTRPMIFYELYDLVSHHINTSDKYFEKDYVYKAGAIVEVYNWLNTYAIDDVFDNSNSRQGEETLHIKFLSRKNAFLLGSIGHCLSLVYLYQLTCNKPDVEKKLLDSLNNAQYLMYLGQPIDIDLTFENRKEVWKFYKANSLDNVLEKYFSRIYGICGAFYEEIGRMAVKSTNVGAQFYHQEEAESACIQIAKLFGLVQMIRNDLGDLIFPEEMAEMSKGMKDTSHNDIMEGKLTLPVIYAIFNSDTNPRDRKMLINSIGNRNLSEKNKLELSRIIWESGAIDYSIQFIEYFSKEVSDQYIRFIDETPTRLKWIIKLMDITPLINLSFKKLAIKEKWRKLEPQFLDNDYINNIATLTNNKNFLEKFEK